jgi:sulfur carrier protein ThiS
VRVRIKLLGTLPSHYPGSYPASGIEADLPAGTTAADIVTFVGIPTSRLGFVSVNGRIAKESDPIPEEATVKLFQNIAGG